MATRIFGISRGQEPFETTEGVGSATTDDVELTIDLAKIGTREEALIALNKLEQYIVGIDWPPA